MVDGRASSLFALRLPCETDGRKGRTKIDDNFDRMENCRSTGTVRKDNEISISVDSLSLMMVKGCRLKTVLKIAPRVDLNGRNYSVSLFLTLLSVQIDLSRQTKVQRSSLSWLGRFT
jgi:hypothetical protein